MEAKIQFESDGRNDAYVFEMNPKEVERFINKLELLIDRYNINGFNPVNNNLLEFFENIGGVK